MLSGVKFIPRDELNSVSPVEQNSKLYSLTKERKKARSRKEKHRSKSKRAHYGSSDDEGTDSLKKRSNRKKWYSSDASSSSLSQTESESFSNHDEEGRRKGKMGMRDKHRREDDKSNRNSGGEVRGKLKKRSKRRKKHDSSEESLSSASESDDGGHSGNKDWKGERKDKRSHSKKQAGIKAPDEKDSSDDSTDLVSRDDKELARKEMGLEWMLKPVNLAERKPKHTDDPLEKPQVEEVEKLNPRELNPYLKDNGSGYPEDASQTEAGANKLLTSSVVGDGGASWRLKALKRAQEQAAREGRKLDEVVEERWGSLGQLTVSVASSAAAPARAHLHAIKDRKRERTENYENVADDQTKKGTENARGRGDKREYFRDASFRRSQMREPKVHDSLSWGKRKAQKMSVEDTRLISEAASNINKYANDGNFLCEYSLHQKKDADGSGSSSHTNIERNEHPESELVSSKTNHFSEGCSISKQVLSANQLAAKVLHLRMKGKHEEAEKLLKESESTIVEQDTRAKATSQDTIISYTGRDVSSQHKKMEDADMHLAMKIVHNKQYSMSGRADDEYDFDDGPSKRQKQKKGGFLEHKTEKNNTPNRFLTQQERCHFCFENPTRPKHLVVSIANFTYLMLPQWQPVVQGHCCILTLQHESATRSVDNNVWDEIRNFKKCLIMMFDKQDKKVVFLETVMGLAQQRRHCLVECIPLPCEIANQAPLYFKKAIDEAEDEWSQHNAKRLIDTSKKGLRGSIPKDFPYFHVEFGLSEGFVHVIDDERQFKSNLGLNVIRGMLRLPEEDMYRRRKQDSVEMQKQAVASFQREWGPFDWTKQLD